MKLLRWQIWRCILTRRTRTYNLVHFYWRQGLKWPFKRIAIWYVLCLPFIKNLVFLEEARPTLTIPSGGWCDVISIVFSVWCLSRSGKPVMVMVWLGWRVLMISLWPSHKSKESLPAQTVSCSLYTDVHTTATTWPSRRNISNMFKYFYVSFLSQIFSTKFGSDSELELGWMSGYLSEPIPRLLAAWLGSSVKTLIDRRPSANERRDLDWPIRSLCIVLPT